MTPDLLKKIAANPLLRKGFGDPRCQAAMAEMQTDPQAAMRKYGDQPEMRSFLQAFMKLMGEHFSALADKQDEEKARAGPALTPEEVLTPEQKKAQEVAQRAMSDPEVRAIVAEPKIQELLATMQSGKPFELEKAMRTDPEVVKKLKKLNPVAVLTKVALFVLLLPALLGRYLGFTCAFNASKASHPTKNAIADADALRKAARGRTTLAVRRVECRPPTPS